MLHRVRWIGSLGIVGWLATPLGGSAEAVSAERAKPVAPIAASQPRPETAAWSDAHMRSNFNAAAANKATRPPVQGSSGYGAFAAGTAETRTQVPETLETVTQRQWEQGSFKGRSKRTRSASPGRRPTGFSRASSLRAGAVSRRR